MRESTGYEKAAFFLLWLYLWIVLFLQKIYVDACASLAAFVLLGVLGCGIAGAVIWLSRRQWGVPAVQEHQHSLRITVVGTLLTCAVYAGYFAIQYPGATTPDVWDQYAQAMGQTAYNDWHPVLHTILFFTLPLKMGGDLGLIVFLQILYFCLAFGYLLHVLVSNRCPVVVLGLLCVNVWLNPVLSGYLVYPWKDIAMTIFAMLLMGQYIQVLCSKGAWLQKWWNLLAFAVVAAICTYMRHNAILFTAPMVLITLFYAVRERKLRVRAAVCVAVCLCLVKLLYAGLDVQKPGQRVVETVGLPATIWCNVMQKAPEALPEETRELLYRFAPPEIYQNEYVVGSFNSAKWCEEVDLDVINALSYGQVAKITYQCFRYAPEASMDALCKLTGMVYVLKGWDSFGSMYIGGALKNHSLTWVARVLFSRPAALFFSSLGAQMLCMLLLAAVALARGRGAFVHALPLFCYNFGTMLLLSGNDYRFFLPSVLLWLPVSWVIAQDTKKIPTLRRGGNQLCKKSS